MCEALKKRNKENQMGQKYELKAKKINYLKIVRSSNGNCSKIKASFCGNWLVPFCDLVYRLLDQL